jgi:cytochrome P450
MTDQELRDELMTLLGAGHETTATGLAWAFERILRTPHVLERLTADPDDDEYLDAVVKETLRVRPVVTDCARKLTSDATVAGFELPKGALVLPAIALLNRHPDLWPDPEEFRPERFLEGQPDPYSWIPFGGGVRRCIGAAFAMQEMKIVLREILTRVRLSAADPAPEPPRVRHVTIVPARGARVVVEEKLEAPMRKAPSASPSTPEQPSPTPSPVR